MTPTHVLLDLDGTISDSSPGIGASLRAAFTACGHEPPDEATIRTLIGPPFEQSFPRIGVPPELVEPIITAYRSHYEITGWCDNRVYDGIAEVLAALDGPVTLALATAKPEPTAIRIVEHFGFSHHFAVRAGAAAAIVGGRRTKADVITHALDLLGIDAGSHVVMVGDRDHDVEGAAANGIDCIGVTWGFGSRDELVGAGAAATVDSPSDLAALLLG
jgi:phosphoglycolate phosphatase